MRKTPGERHSHHHRNNSLSYSSENIGGNYNRQWRIDQITGMYKYILLLFIYINSYPRSYCLQPIALELVYYNKHYILLKFDDNKTRNQFCFELTKHKHTKFEDGLWNGKEFITPL